MRTRFAGAIVFAMAAVAAAAAQTARAPRTADGKPNLTGIWQVMNTANWDIQAHEARQGPVIALGAAFSIPPGPGVVEGNEIPYRPEAVAKKKENQDNWLPCPLGPSQGNGRCRERPTAARICRASGPTTA